MKPYDRYRYDIIRWLCVCNACFSVILLIITKEFTCVAGTLISTAVVSINLVLLDRGVGMMINKNRVATGVAIHVLRLLAYCVCGYICYRLSFYAILGYSAGIIGFPIATCIAFLRKEGADG